MFNRTLLAALIVSAAVPAVLRAENANTPSEVNAATMSASALKSTPADSKVLASIHHDNLMEIEMGKLALKNGSSEAVRQFGDRLVKDHQAAETKVAELAAKMDINLVDEKPMAEKDHAKMEKLQSLKGEKFDRAFAKAMVEDHNKAIENLKAAQPKLGTSPTGALVAEVLPIIQEHARIASEIAANAVKANKPS